MWDLVRPAFVGRKSLSLLPIPNSNGPVLSMSDTLAQACSPTQSDLRSTHSVLVS